MVGALAVFTVWGCLHTSLISFKFLYVEEGRWNELEAGPLCSSSSDPEIAGSKSNSSARCGSAGIYGQKLHWPFRCAFWLWGAFYNGGNGVHPAGSTWHQQFRLQVPLKTTHLLSAFRVHWSVWHKVQAICLLLRVLCMLYLST